MNFGETIKRRREQLEMTQQELAQKLFVSRQTVCRWENGTRCPGRSASRAGSAGVYTGQRTDH